MLTTLLHNELSLGCLQRHRWKRGFLHFLCFYENMDYSNLFFWWWNEI